MATKLHVANLPPDCTDQELHDMFSTCGPVVELDIIKNFAFIHMGSNESAQKAMVKFHNSSFNGRVIAVQFSKIQNVNRANKFTVKYDRSDRMGRGGQGGQVLRGGLRGRCFAGIAGNAGGPGNDFRGRAGFRGGKGGPDNFHRGKPYDRNPGLNQNQQQNSSNYSNLQPIRHISTDVNAMSTPKKFTLPHIQNIAVPQNQPSQVLPVQVQARPLQQIPVQVASPTMPPQLSNMTQHHVLRGPQQIVTQNVSYQQIQSFNELQSQVQTAAPQQIVGPGVIQQQSLPPTGGQPISNVQPFLQSTGMTPGVNYQQPSNPLHGYTVYERYVDYRNPHGEIQQIVAHNQSPGGAMPVTSPVYPGSTQSGIKDPYVNAQLMYER